MFIYSITYALDPSIEHDWVSWMKNHTIPQLIEKGTFIDSRFSKTMPDRGVDIAYNIQLRCDSMEQIIAFETKISKPMSDEMANRYGNTFGSFHTVLEEL